MIDAYLKFSRASFNKKENIFIELYHKQFEKYLTLFSKIHPEIKVPKIKIVHSLNRLCETFIYGNETYIVYDQYLGQSFNKMNRILFQENDKEALAYICKILGEEYFMLNDIHKSTAYMIFYQLSRNANAKDLSEDFKKYKDTLISIQESFVFFHEFSHSIVSADRRHIKYANEFLSSDESGKKLIESISQIIIDSKMPPEKINFYFEEVACDFLAVNFTHGIYSQNSTIKYSQIFEGITSAFLYLRTIYDLKNKARNIEDDLFTLFTKFRYNSLRNYISKMFLTNDSDFQDLVNVYELWEKKFDMKVVTRINSGFEKKVLDTFQGKKLDNYNLLLELIGINP